MRPRSPLIPSPRLEFATRKTTDGVDSRGSVKPGAPQICEERCEALPPSRRDLSGVRLVALFLDAISSPGRPSGAKEGMVCAWGFTETPRARALSLCLRMGKAGDD